MSEHILDGIKEFQSSEKLKELLFEYSTIRHLKEGDIILSENSSIKAIPIVTKGCLKVIKTDDEGKEILLYYIKAGESCVMSFLGGLHDERSALKAIADEDTEVLFLPVSKVHFFIKEFPQWLEYIFNLYHKRFEELLEIIRDITFKKVDERLLLLLQKKVDAHGNRIIHATHEQIANELGTARVVVSRLLKQLEEDGKVRLGRNRITLNY